MENVRYGLKADFECPDVELRSGSNIAVQDARQLRPLRLQEQKSVSKWQSLVSEEILGTVNWGPSGSLGRGIVNRDGFDSYGEADHRPANHPPEEAFSQENQAGLSWLPSRNSTDHDRRGRGLRHRGAGRRPLVATTGY